jgi:C-terminal processing protease CtpA/Prc
MEARYLEEFFGGDLGVVYGVSVSSAKLLLSDGRSLERTGVTPDQLILPTAADLASGRDPALARAAALAALDLDPEAAGKLFPMKWQPF